MADHTKSRRIMKALDAYGEARKAYVKLLTDKENIIIAHALCHQQYHDLPVRKQPWREGFLERLRERYPNLYYKEREKENK